MQNLLFANEILTININEELNGAAFYAALAESTKNQRVAQVAEDLAEQEKYHAERFAKLQQELKGEESGNPDVRTKEYLSWLAEKAMFKTADSARLLAGSGDDISIVRFAIKTENATIELLNELKKYVSGNDAEVVDATIDEEQDHIEQLTELLKELE